MGAFLSLTRGLRFCGFSGALVDEIAAQHSEAAASVGKGTQVLTQSLQ